MKQLKIIKSQIEQRNCSICGRHAYVVKVLHIKTGETEWRCSRDVRKLINGGREIGHQLAGKDKQKLEKLLERKSKKTTLAKSSKP